MVCTVFLLVAGCGRGDIGQQGRTETATVPGLDCATDGASDYGTGCTIERSGTTFTIHSPTGSFRRLRVTNGHIAAADGAEPARINDGDAQRVEVAIGGDRYRIPRDALR